MIIYYILKLIFPLALMSCLIQLKYSIKKSCIIIGIVHFIILIINYVIYTYKGVNFLEAIFPLTESLPAFVCFYLLSETKGVKFIFSFLTVCNLSLFKSYIGVLALTINNNLYFSTISEALVLILILFFLIKLFRKPYFKIINTLSKGWGIFCSVPSLLAVIIYLLNTSKNNFNNYPENMLIAFLVFVLMFIFYAIVYFNFDNITHYYQLKEDKELMVLQTDMQKKEYDAIIDKISAIQIYRHDLRHHINVMNTFLDDNNILEVQRYLAKLDDSLSKTIVEKYCENYSVNVILSSYIKKAKKEYIDVVSQVNISQNVRMQNMELVLIFANAIENAINACKKIQDLNARRLNIICKEHFGQIYIQITNTFVGEIMFNGEYPVSNSTDHGIGTRSISKIAEKYGGIFSFKAEDGIFSTTVILNLE